MSKRILDAAPHLYPIGLAILIIGIGVFLFANGAQSSIEDMQFEQTHPIVQATVQSVSTYTYHSKGSIRINICADTAKFLAKGQEVTVNVKSLMVCSVVVGSQLEIAYDPQNPSHFRLVPIYGPFWGNLIAVIVWLILGGIFFSIGVPIASTSISSIFE